MMRKQFAGFAASALALAVSAQAMAGTVTTDGTDIVIKTKSGLEVATTDKQYSFKLGGRIQADFDQFDGFYTTNNDAGNEAYFRRAQLELGGNYKDWRYQINYDLAIATIAAVRSLMRRPSPTPDSPRSISAWVALIRTTAWKRPPAPSG